ncbi:IS3 family transposase [Nitrosomonas supralitoralis]|uniref:HTH-like domain-containing protein n=1 Tax=Nitrosomonas supralitoralis TaxID=2116706 RepID=A0A2P7NR92_9PROT|nr:IS3 family transposase [Nitrosomonas supralitoralis]PSJ15992.1 hypothetical protein C7H79_16005 [Nitrosomonas supralitoralis]
MNINNRSIALIDVNNFYACQLFYEYKQTYGYRRLSDAINEAGMKSGHYQVRHLMARPVLKARYSKRFKVATDSNHNELISQVL